MSLSLLSIRLKFQEDALTVSVSLYNQSQRKVDNHTFVTICHKYSTTLQG